MKVLSLRRRLFERLVPALVVVALLSGVTTYTAAQRSANLAYDQALMAAAIDVATGVEVESGRLRFDLSSQSERILRSDARDDIYYAVRTQDGRFVAGDEDLSPTPVVRLADGSSVDVAFRKSVVRALTMRFAEDTTPYLVTVGETLRKRQEAGWSNFALMMGPTLIALLLLLTIVWIAVKASLQPLRTLSGEIERRSEIDLSPIDLSGSPREVHTLVEATNRLMRRVQASSTAYESFVADTAHQLRTPLAQILTDVDLLDSSMVDRSMRQRFERVRQSIHRSTRLLSQLLLLARSQGDAYSTHADVVDLEVLVSSSADLWVHRALDRRIDLGFDLAPAVVFGDAHLLREMVENLMDNALRHTSASGTITVSTATVGTRCIAAVDDSGTGIAVADRDAVFIRFNQVGEKPGSGLGLSIVQRIARRHGGDVAIVDSACGGARFEVDLPAAEHR